MNVPRWVGHNHIELAEHRHIKRSNVAVHPLDLHTRRDGVVVFVLLVPHLPRLHSALAVVHAVDRGLVDDVVDELASARVAAGVEVGAVAEGDVCVREDDAREMHLRTARLSLHFLQR